ncbi:DNA polymerase [Thiogranum longum]|uniref:Type-4 uracil-DNA glycosylase n=1 Tax=Thiogranum longum TaxID=1537524 RepID=A0A4R1HE73_9GAMM|nr:uracil-DNA glycosylase [Thiogranum longum]TCK17629.1 DNA polymerase [Thiogranum longum]
MNRGGDTAGNAKQQYLDAMGILRWQRRASGLPENAQPAGDEVDVSLPPDNHEGERSQEHARAAPPRKSHDSPAVIRTEPENDSAGKGSPQIAGLDWDTLRSRVSECTACELHTSRTQTVFGTGNRNADWLVIGEAPGADEDAQGEPFVGRAGQLLNAMLLACGLEREQVYIANILKCRPPDNRDPRPGEVASCEPYLMRQIELIQPKLILAVGRIAAQNLLQCDTPIGKLRGSVHTFRDTGIPLVATYHPAYLLRSPAEKRKAWQDLQLAMQIVNEASS